MPRAAHQARARQNGHVRRARFEDGTNLPFEAAHVPTLSRARLMGRARHADRERSRSVARGQGQRPGPLRQSLSKSIDDARYKVTQQ